MYIANMFIYDNIKYWWGSRGTIFHTLLVPFFIDTATWEGNWAVSLKILNLLIQQFYFMMIFLRETFAREVEALFMVAFEALCVIKNWKQSKCSLV